MPRLTNRSVAAFTLLELLTVVIIIGILAAMTIGVASDIRSRADAAACSANLKNLYAAGAAYVQDNGRWPQISTNTIKIQGDTRYPNAWIAAFKPYNMGQINWICPTVQREMHNPDLSVAANVRIDYIGTPFDNLPNTPFRWPHQPWFMERGAVHPGGNLLIWSNGQIVNLTEALRYSSPAQ